MGFTVFTRLRVVVHKIVTYPLFDTVIMVIIALRFDFELIKSVILWTKI